MLCRLLSAQLWLRQLLQLRKISNILSLQGQQARTPSYFLSGGAGNFCANSGSGGWSATRPVRLSLTSRGPSSHDTAAPPSRPPM
jgi:hypothetical protein